MPCIAGNDLGMLREQEESWCTWNIVNRREFSEELREVSRDQIMCGFINPGKEFSLHSKWIGKPLHSCKQGSN